MRPSAARWTSTPHNRHPEILAPLLRVDDVAVSCAWPVRSRLWADAHQLQQAVNLLTNAQRCGRGAPAQVTLTAR